VRENDFDTCQLYSFGDYRFYFCSNVWEIFELRKDEEG